MRRVETIPLNDNKNSRVRENSPEQIRKELWLELLSAKSEPERAVLRCAMSILHDAQAFEIDPVTGNAYTVAGFERAAASGAVENTWNDRKEDAEANPYRHDFAMEGRAVQARYAEVHPRLADPVWFPDHGPRSCIYCRMEANETAGLPSDAGINWDTGTVMKPEQPGPVEMMPPGMEDAA